MPRCRFQLPGYEDLTKEQDDALALPKDGQHLVVGGPGTGKSVLALLRARRHDRDGDPYVFLVYNHLLHNASRQLFGSSLVSRTWKSWFGREYWQTCGERLPTLPQPGQFPPLDWSEVARTIADASIDQDTRRPSLIIDEGQDMPRQFYDALVNLGFENFFVVADFNQQLNADENSSRADIEAVLALEPSRVIELRENHRNEHRVAKLAQAFCPEDPACPAPELPPPRPSERTPVLVDYADHQFDSLIARILKLSDRDPNRLVGLIAPNNQVRQRYYEALRSSRVQLDHGPPLLRTYQHGMHPDLAFDRGGIAVINAQSCKGLQFDTVILLDVNDHLYSQGDPRHVKHLFYVMAARACEYVIILRNAERRSRVDPILPTDEAILEYRN